MVRERCMFKGHCHYQKNKSSCYVSNNGKFLYCIQDVEEPFGTCNQKESDYERIQNRLIMIKGI